MAGNNSEIDDEVPKQLPLNAEEVDVLESYLEQWDSTSGQERSAVWGDATREARLKAPTMDAKLLKSRRTVYRKWLQNHGGKMDMKPPINLGQKWTYQMVVGSLRKKELLSKIEDKTGVKTGEPGMMNHYSKYLTEMVNSLTEKEVKEATEMATVWNKQGVPPKSDEILRYVAGEIFKKAGMRLFMLSAWKNEEGKLLVSSHDYNDKLGNGESFTKTCDWQVVLPEWETYVSKQFNKEVDDDAMVKKGRKDNTYTLEIGGNGLPILLDHAEMDSDTRKAVVRAFLNWHYQDCSGKPKDPVPWKEVIPRQEVLIPLPYLPEGMTLQEPLRMNQDEATILLDFWYNQQENCHDVIFEFYGWWSKADKEVKPPVARIIEAEVGEQEGELLKQTSGGIGKTRTLNKRKSKVWAVIPPDSLDDGKEIESQMTTMASKKSKVLPAKKTGASKPRVDSEDAFQAPNSSNKSSGDEMPVVRIGKASVNQKANRLRKDVATKAKRAPEASSEHGMDEELQGNQPVNQIRAQKWPTIAAKVTPAPLDKPTKQDQTAGQSASRTLPTPSEKPRRVRPTSCLAGIVRGNPGDPSKTAVDKPTKAGRGKKQQTEVVLHGTAEKRTRGQANAKKRPAEDCIEGSPAKRTRSKTADVPPKRSKKPNSRYARNYV
ncbi:hypothetical protein F4604DRAFT_1677023 [Suillus subluteus]|nr:hypothetical protein F4604DRAFT_1677023 [Suillus subluteus]